MCSYSWRVPLHALGELKIVASCDIGELGPKEGAAILYHWSPLYNVLGMLPWLLVAAVFLFFKENRCGQTLWILLPVVLFRLLWAGFAAIAGIPSETAILFISIINCLLIGFILNWLMAERIGNRNRFVTWLFALLLFALAFGAILTDIGTGLEALQVSIFIGLTVGVLLLSVALAGFLCRRKFGPVRFSLWLALWVLILVSLFFVMFALIQSLMSPGMKFSSIAGQVIMVSLVYSGIIIAGLLPFEILLFKNTFWRKRFEAVFGLKKNAVVEQQGIQLKNEV